MKLFTVVALASLIATPAFGDELNCQAGQDLVTFADGTDVAEVCVDHADMEPTVVNPDVPVGVDPSNTDGL